MVDPLWCVPELFGRPICENKIAKKLKTGHLQNLSTLKKPTIWCTLQYSNSLVSLLYYTLQYSNSLVSLLYYTLQYSNSLVSLLYYTLQYSNSLVSLLFYTLQYSNSLV